MRKTSLVALLLAMPLFYVACSGDEGKKTENNEIASTEVAPEEKIDASENLEAYDPARGEGKFDESNVKVGALDAGMASKGKSISETKCFSCHKASDELLVGPGWKGVSERHTPYWLMNFITNPDAMLDKDPKLQEQLEICLVRMPDQNLEETEAREIVEYMRQNDGVK
ncbi:MAG TPA: c-type cytochrome [Edaphocola sp.]|nr:c-type cytochrome [Edaphocola sp.]